MIDIHPPVYDISAVELPVKNIYNKYIQEAANKYNIDKRIIKKIITIESSWQPKLVSKAGAKGLMQIMPQNFRIFRIPNHQHFTPEINIDIGTRIFRLCYNSINKLSETIPMTDDEKLKLTLASYNLGPTTIRRRIKTYGVENTLIQRLPLETKYYLKKFYGEVKVTL